ncbi:MAG TPA: acyl-CoA thioesterase [Longimicrobiaceae bacterium]|nr:acyl-CoA thioesterase [Longimicrobiaceae bacterium]
MIRTVDIYRKHSPPDPAVPRPVRVSQVTFADLAEPHSMNVAGTLFGGTILGFIDRAAAFCAMKHAGRPVVTKNMDSVEFNEPIYIGELVVAMASVNYAGTTSMEVGIKVMAQNPISGQERHTNTCYATFVALDEEGRPTRVPQVLPESDDEKRRYEAGRQRRDERLSRRRHLKG